MSRGRPPDLAVVTCADLDCDSLGWLHLAPGEVHVLANAGGIVTDDTVSDLARARVRLGVARVVVVHHTPCGLLDHDDGGRPANPLDRLRESMARLVRSPLCLPPSAVHGVLGGADGALTRIDLP